VTCHANVPCICAAGPLNSTFAAVEVVATAYIDATGRATRTARVKSYCLPDANLGCSLAGPGAAKSALTCVHVMSHCTLGVQLNKRACKCHTLARVLNMLKLAVQPHSGAALGSMVPQVLETLGYQVKTPSLW
jgi:hypothetical protein